MRCSVPPTSHASDFVNNIRCIKNDNMLALMILLITLGV